MLLEVDSVYDADTTLNLVLKPSAMKFQVSMGILLNSAENTSFQDLEK